MKVVIDTDDKLYNRIKYLEPSSDTTLDELIRSVQSGTPLSDNATNGDVLTTLFPTFKAGETNSDTVVLEQCYPLPTCVMQFNRKWWNTPFKDKESEATVDEIEVGDEVVYHEHTKGVAVRVMLDCHEPYYVLCANGGMMIRTNRQSLEKTGRHFPQIAEVLELMKE